MEKHDRLRAVICALLGGLILLCGCGRKPDWEYEQVRMPEDNFKLAVHLKHSDAEGTNGFLDFTNEYSAIEVLNLVGSEGWELAWMSADEKTFIVKRQRQKLGSFYTTEEEEPKPKREQPF